MPRNAFKNLADDDLKPIFAYFGDPPAIAFTVRNPLRKPFFARSARAVILMLLVRSGRCAHLSTRGKAKATQAGAGLG